MHTIAIGCDPNAAEAKRELIAFLEKKAMPSRILEAKTDLRQRCGGGGDGSRRREVRPGILICGTGIGVSLAANKVKGAYAALLADVYSAERPEKATTVTSPAFGALPSDHAHEAAGGGISHQRV
jgi:ribose 5-phosphate isomerase B